MTEIFAYDHEEGLEMSMPNFPPSSLIVIAPSETLTMIGMW